MGMDLLVIYKEAKPLAISLYQFYIGEMFIKYQTSNTPPPQTQARGCTTTFGGVVLLEVGVGNLALISC